MDKNKTGYYRKNGQELMIESVCAGDLLLRDVIKGFVLEKQRTHMMATDQGKCNNHGKNRIVATPKEVC